MRTAETVGDSRSVGSSDCIRSMASFVSMSASEISFSRTNEIVIMTLLSVINVVICFTPETLAIESSTLRATSVSSWEGAAPGRDKDTSISGKAISGKS